MIHRPRQFNILVGLGLLAIPIFILNIWVMQKGQISKIFSPDKLVWIGICSFWVLINTYWLFNAKWRGFWSFIALSVITVAANVYFLLAFKNYALAFYALFLLILSGLYVLHLYRNLSEAYYSTGQRWFEGKPLFIPRVEAELRNGKNTISVRLSRLGVEGCYAFFATSDQESLDHFESVSEIALKLGDLSVDCAVELISKTKDGTGRGLKFQIATADQSKDIRDFIDRVRSSGYVS